MKQKKQLLKLLNFLATYFEIMNKFKKITFYILEFMRLAFFIILFTLLCFYAFSLFSSKVSATTEKEIKNYICTKGWDCKKAIRIAICESSLNPKAKNEKGRDRSYGIFQINIYGSLTKNRPSKQWLLDWKNNINYAYKLYLSSGKTFKAWSCK
jgi:hypothetical protein